MLVWHTLDCLLRPPRRCLVYGILLLRKNERTGADLQAGKRQRIAHGQDRQWGFAQYEPRIFACVYNRHRFASSPPDHLGSLGSTSSPHSSRNKLRQARPQASSSAFGACVLTFPVDPKPLVWFVNCVGCVDRACSSLHSIRQFTSRSVRVRRMICDRDTPQSDVSMNKWFVTFGYFTSGPSDVFNPRSTREP